MTSPNDHVHERSSVPDGGTVLTANQVQVRARIKAAAVDYMRCNGTTEIPMRAIARAVDMKPSSLYRYYDHQSQLQSELTQDAYYAATREMVATRTGLDATMRQQFFAVAQSFRAWALQHPQEYALLWGAPNLEASWDSNMTAAASACLSVPADIVVHAIANGEIDVARAALDPDDVDVEIWRAVLADVSDVAAVITITGFTTLVGEISLEAFGLLEGLIRNRDRLFHAQVTAAAALMGFVPA